MGIASMVMAASLAAVGRIARMGTDRKGADEQEDVLQRMEWLLRDDLMQGKSCRNLSDGVEIETASSLQAKTMRREHLPVTVRYEVLERSGRKILVRCQRFSKAPESRELVCAGVQEVAVTTGGRDERRNVWLPLRGAIRVRCAMAGDPREERTFEVRR